MARSSQYLRLPLLPFVLSGDSTSESESQSKVVLKDSLLGKVEFQEWLEFDSMVEAMERKVESLPDDWTWQARKHLEDIRYEVTPSSRCNAPFTLHQILQRLHTSEASTSMHGASPNVGSTYQNERSFGTSVYNTSTSSNFVNILAFKAIEKLLMAVRGDENLYLLERIEVRSEKFNHLDNDEPAAMTIRLKSDFSLTTVPVKNVSCIMPICTFELKGPYFHLCAADSLCPLLREHEVVDTWSNEEFNACSGRPFYARQDQREPQPEEAHPNIGRFQFHALSDLNHVSRFAPRRYAHMHGEERQTSRSPILNIGQGSVPTHHSATDLVKLYNYLFLFEEAADDDLVDSVAQRRRNLVSPISQTLSQGLQSKTGCCALYTHQELVCFKIQTAKLSDKPGTEKRLVVKVSRCYLSNEARSNVLAALTLLDHALTILSLDMDLPKLIRKEFRIIAKEQKILESMERVAPESSSTEQETGASDSDQDEKSYVPSTEDDESDSLEVLEPIGGQDQREHLEFRETRELVETSEVSQSAQDRSDRSDCFLEEVCQEVDVTAPGNVYGYKNWQYFSLEKSYKKEQWLEHNEETIGHGRAANVFLSTVAVRCDEKPVRERVAVKVWNRNHKDGLDEMRNEMHTYSLLSSRKAEVVGLGIPRLMTARRLECDAFIVLEFVGKGIRITPDGLLIVGERTASEIIDSKEDIIGIRDSALKNLKLLHHADVLHRDIALRNLRVRRQYDQGERSVGERWRTWWIDLGRAKDCRGLPESNSSFLKRVEQIECVALFTDALKRLV